MTSSGYRGALRRLGLWWEAWNSDGEPLGESGYQHSADPSGLLDPSLSHGEARSQHGATPSVNSGGRSRREKLGRSHLPPRSRGLRARAALGPGALGALALLACVQVAWGVADLTTIVPTNLPHAGTGLAITIIGYDFGTSDAPLAIRFFLDPNSEPGLHPQR